MVSGSGVLSELLSLAGTDLDENARSRTRWRRPGDVQRDLQAFAAAVEHDLRTPQLPPHVAQIVDSGLRGRELGVLGAGM